VDLTSSKTSHPVRAYATECLDKVKKWLSLEQKTIPFDETRNYTKRVLASFFTYCWLYGNRPVPAVPLEARVRAKPGPTGADDRRDRSNRSGRTKAARR